MKRGLAVIILLILAAILISAQYLYVTSQSELYIKMLDIAEEQLADNEVIKAQESIEKLDHRFVGSSGMLKLFLYHADVDTVSVNLSMMRRYIQHGELEEYMALSAGTKRMLHNICESQQMCVHNIL